MVNPKWLSPGPTTSTADNVNDAELADLSPADIGPSEGNRVRRRSFGNHQSGKGLVCLFAQPAHTVAQAAVRRAAAPHPQRPQEPVQLFFGEMNRGNPVLGVIETPEGFIAGRFTAGRVNADPDRNTLIKAFQIAASAARAANNRYKAAGNEASARFYATRAQELDRQLD